MAGLPVVGSARRVSAAELAALLAEKETLESAELAAQEIVEKAAAEAAKLRARAEAEWEAHQERLKDVADAQLTRFVDVTRVEKGAEAMLGMMRTSAGVRQDFDQLEHWLTDLVIASVTRIVGAMPEDEKWRGLLSTALEAVRDRWALTLQCSPSDLAVITRLKAQNPDLMESIKEVQAIPDLEPGTCLLINANGVVDAGIETKLKALEDHLSQMLMTGGDQ